MGLANTFIFLNELNEQLDEFNSVDNQKKAGDLMELRRRIKEEIQPRINQALMTITTRLNKEFPT